MGAVTVAADHLADAGHLARRALHMPANGIFDAISAKRAENMADALGSDFALQSGDAPSLRAPRYAAQTLYHNIIVIDRFSEAIEGISDRRGLK